MSRPTSTSTGRHREPQLHQREQRHPSGEELGVVAVLGEQRDRGLGRVGALVVERGRDHAPASRGRQHRAHDVVVAGAAAEVALEPEPDLALGRVGVLLEQRDRGEHHARGAEAALQPMLLVERLLDRMQLPVARQALDRGDRRAVGLDREHRARLHRLAVDEHRARTTARRVAADLRARQPGGLAQVLHEQRPGLDVMVLLRSR